MSVEPDALRDIILRDLPIGVGVSDARGRVRYLNAEVLALLGFESLDRRAERVLAALLSGDVAQGSGRSVLVRALQGERVTGEAVIYGQRTADGGATGAPGLLLGAQAIESGGEPLVVFTLQASTAQSETGAAITRAHALIEGITAGTDDLIAAEDGNFRYTFFNEAYRREFRTLWGIDIEVGTSMLEALSAWPEERDKARDLWRRALDGENFSITMEFGPAAETRQIYDLRFNPIYDPERRLIGAAHILRNVTDRVRTLEALEQSQAALKEADERKDEFIATLAHELRNPLAPIQSGIEILRGDPGNGRALDMMQRQMTQLVRLVDDLLDISRISRGRIVLRREIADLAPLIDSALESSRAAFSHGRRTVTVDIPADLPLVDVDTVRVVQVVANLVNNAVKFTPDDGRIDIAARAGEGHVGVSVRDNGSGIEIERLEQIFELFDQGDATDTSGLGIGLTLVRNLIELHGGSVEALSGGAGQGSVFVVHIPTGGATVSVEPETGQASRPRPLDGQRILIADDNEDAVHALEMLLRNEGAETRSVFDGQAALECCSSFEPQVVILDIGMPKLDGCEVARRIRASQKADEVRLIALTGWSQSDDIARILESGFDHHLAKPVRLDSIIELLGAPR